VFLAALAVTGCGAATSGGLPRPPAMTGAAPGPAVAPAAAASDGLRPQDLAPGTCAAFFWTAGTSHRFVAFENETEGYARVFANGREHAFRTPPREGIHMTGDAYRRDYVDPARGLDIRISGTMGEALPQGQRIERAAMRVVQPDGGTRVMPLVGHYACRVPVE
jgi:hypothetical protein